MSLIYYAPSLCEANTQGAARTETAIRPVVVRRCQVRVASKPACCRDQDPENVMARKRKFSHYIEFWTTPEQFEAFEALQEGGLLNKSDHYRAAFEFYLRQVGALVSPKPTINGQHHQEVRDGLQLSANT